MKEVANMKIKAKPTPEHPNRMMVTFPSGHAVFSTRDDAQGFTGHVGAIGDAAVLYLETVK
jgi:hypothetical protein